MNINTLQKHYGKLTTRERFALLVAAGARGDDAERAALLQSAPRRNWSAPVTNGIAEAFNYLSMFYVIMQLGKAASFYFLLFNEDEISIENFEYNDAMILIQRRILEGSEAWRAVCKEYGVDPVAVIEPLPFKDIIDMVELTVRAANVEYPIELTDLQSAIDEYKSVIEAKYKEWE